jgi:hypothetical protein
MMMLPGMRLATAAVAVVAVGCGVASIEEGPRVTSTEAVTSSAVTTTTTSPPTTTTEAVTTTVAQATTTMVDEHSDVPPGYPPPVPTGGEPLGSGCEPPGETLPDGAWYGTLEFADEGSIGFDSVCYWIGDAADVEAAAGGGEANNGFWRRNPDARVATLPVNPDVPVFEIPADAPDTFAMVHFSEWPADASGYIPCPGDACGVWVYVANGEVTQIVEQYAP